MILETSDQVGFKIKKVGGTSLLPIYEIGLLAAIEQYGIENQSFNHPKTQVIEGALRLLQEYKVDQIFITDFERNLLVLALSDAWLSSETIKEKKALLDILKLVATGANANGEYGTLSSKVKLLTTHGSPRGTQFNPDSTAANSHSEYIDEVIKYIEEHTDIAATAEVSKTMVDWSSESKLAEVRNKLQIAGPHSEKPFEVIVLNQSAFEMINSIGLASFFLVVGNKYTVVFNSDYQRFDSLEHEYAHSQSVGIDRWYQNLLFRGINEAVTEESIRIPHAYFSQRSLLKWLLVDHPEYDELLSKTYMGDEPSRKKLFSLIINHYGLANFLLLTRVSPDDNLKLFGAIGESIYIEPSAVLVQLSKHRSKPNEKSKEKVTFAHPKDNYMDFEKLSRILRHRLQGK